MERIGAVGPGAGTDGRTLDDDRRADDRNAGLVGHAARHHAGLVIHLAGREHDVVARELPAELRPLDQTVEHGRQRLLTSVERHAVVGVDVLRLVEEHQRRLFLNLYDGVVERTAVHRDADPPREGVGLRRNRHFAAHEQEKQRQDDKIQIFFHKFNSS